MSLDNRTINQEFEQCRDAFYILQNTSYLEQHKKDILSVLFHPDTALSLWGKAEFLKHSKKDLLSLMEKLQTEKILKSNIPLDELDNVRAKNFLSSSQSKQRWDLLSLQYDRVSPKNFLWWVAVWSATFFALNEFVIKKTGYDLTKNTDFSDYGFPKRDI